MPSPVIRLGAKKKGVAFGLGLCAAALRGWAGARSPVGKRSGRPAVLILEPFGLGDVISLEPLIRALVAQQITVRLCGRREWRLLYPEPVEWVDALVPWGSHSFGHKYRLAAYRSPEFRAFRRTLRTAAQGAVGVDTRGDIRSVILLYLAGCRRVVTLSSYLGSDLRVPAIAAARVDFSSQIRRWELNLGFVPKVTGVSVKETAPPFFAHLARVTHHELATPTPCESATGSRSQQPQAIHGAAAGDRPRSGEKRGLAVPPGQPPPKRIGLVPVAPWEGKLWSSGKWRELASQLRGLRLEITALCGPGQSAATRRAAGEDVALMECGSLSAWAAAFRQCAAIVTLDTGPMHLADALGVPVVALFGQGILPLWAPSGERSRLLTHREADFQPCHPTNENVPLGRRLMDRISVDEVVAAVREILDVH